MKLYFRRSTDVLLENHTKIQWKLLNKQFLAQRGSWKRPFHVSLRVQTIQQVRGFNQYWLNQVVVPLVRPRLLCHRIHETAFFRGDTFQTSLQMASHFWMDDHDGSFCFLSLDVDDQGCGIGSFMDDQR